MWPLFFLSLISSHAISTSRAEHTTSYSGRATTSFISYHKLKTWSLLSKKTINLNLGRRCGKTEIVCHWSLLMSLELAEQSIQLLTMHISRWRLCHRSPQDNQSKSWKKYDLCFFVIDHLSCHKHQQSRAYNFLLGQSNKKKCDLCFLSLITSRAISTSRAEHSTSYRGRATTSFIAYHQLKTWALLSKTINLNLGRRCGQTEIDCHWSLLMSLEIAE